MYTAREFCGDYIGITMVNWDGIDNVFLDMDGTLLDLHFDNHFWLEHLPKRFAEIRGESVEVVRSRLKGEYAKMRGTLDWYCLEYWQRELDIDIVALKREVTDKIRFRPSASQFLEKLGRSGKHVALVSNAHRWSIGLKMELVLSEDLFDAIHSSHDFGYPKEEQAFWRSLQNHSTFDPARTLFIDDNLDVLESAERFGIGHLLAISQPDLNHDPLEPGRFPQIRSFEDLL